MKIVKLIKGIAKVGGWFVDQFERVVDFADHLIHKKEYERRAKRRKIFWTVLLSVTGAILAVLFFPYRVIVKRNGDFEIRSLMLRIYRKTEDYAIPEGGSDSFEIAEVEDETDAIEA